MKILRKETITTAGNGTFDIQLEDWSEDYPDTFMPGNVIAAYPISKVDIGTPFGPRRGQKFRCGFWLPDGNRAQEAFSKLVAGSAELTDYATYMERMSYLPCLTGNWNN